MRPASCTALPRPTAQSRPRRRWTPWAAAALLPLAGCQADVLDPAGPVARAQVTILADSMIIMLAIVVPTIVAILGFAWWYRADNPRAKRRPDFVYSGSVELVTWAIPILTVTLLSGVAWIGSHELDPAKPLASKEKPLQVQVVSLDWKWLFIYPELGIASVNRLDVPVGVPVHFALTSASVLNSFFVPQLGSQLYNMSGMAADLNLLADRPGTFAGLSVHYSGDGFSDMHFEVHAQPRGDFDAWVAEARKAGPVLDAVSYAELSKQSTKVAPYTYRAADPKLFDAVVSLAIPSGPGPTGQPGQSPADAPKQPSGKQAQVQPQARQRPSTDMQAALASGALCIAGEQ